MLIISNKAQGQMGLLVDTKKDLKWFLPF